MKKIVTALIIVLPLVFLIALFAITSVASVSADIPANGLVINNKGVGVFSFDLANYQNKMYEQDLGVEVLPYMAKNKKYSLKVTDANTGEESSIVTLEDDGSFALHDVGVAKLTFTSDDGGYSDSVVFNVGFERRFVLPSPCYWTMQATLSPCSMATTRISKRISPPVLTFCREIFIPQPQPTCAQRTRRQTATQSKSTKSAAKSTLTSKRTA